MEAFLIKAIQLIVALAVLVVIHEFGHYIMARAFGIKVEKFYLFFNPWFSLVKWKPKKGEKKYDKNGNERATWRDTEYGIGWLPLGGYVKIAGMIDESMDKEQLAKPAESWEFRSKPAYQRLLVMIGGVTFNFILAIVIYAGIAWYWGEKYIPFENAYEGMAFVPEAQAVGFRDGDIPLSADGEKLDVSADAFMTMAMAKNVRVLRNHKDTVDIALPSNFALTLSKAKGFMTYRVPVVGAEVQGGSPAKAAGMAVGDRIVGLDTLETRSFDELGKALEKYAGKPTTVSVERDGKLIKLPVTPTDGAKLGFKLKQITDVYPTVSVKYSLLASIPQGWKMGTDKLTSYVKSMKYVFTKDGAQSIGGFGTLGSLFPEKWNWMSFWEIMAFLSVVLAFMNILPIPALDGGHVLFLIYEMVTRKQAPEKVIEYAQIAGMAFLLLLLVYANGMDVVRGMLN